jgi:hypothetical protein
LKRITKGSCGNRRLWRRNGTGNAPPAASRRSSTGCWHLGPDEPVEDLAVQELVVEREPSKLSL